MRSYRQVPGGMMKLASLASLLVAGQALAQSYVNFTLELGGDNKRAAWKSDPNPPLSALFSSGLDADGQLQPLGGNLTWAVRVAAGGTQAAGNGAGQPIQGVANVVFDLELYKDSIAPANLATGVIWNSTINDGTGSDLTASAAFAAVFNLALAGPGRAIDTRSDGGPFLGGPGWPLAGNPPKPPKNARTYPTATPGSGKLIGMGAGYYQWNPGATTRGIGIVTQSDGSPGLGVLPLFEGQMNTSLLTAGTYVLKVTPGAGINVLRGDVNLGLSVNAFATAADQTAGDTITFTLIPIPMPEPPSAPSPAHLATNVPTDVTLTWTAGANATSHQVLFGTSPTPTTSYGDQPGSFTPVGLLVDTTYYWQVIAKNPAGQASGPIWSFTTAPPPPLIATAFRSVRSHGESGDLSVVFDLAATGSLVSVEPRAGGVVHIAIDFSRPVDFIGIPTIIGSNGSEPELVDIVASGQTLELFYSEGAFVNGVCYTIDITDTVMASDSSGFALSGDMNCTFRILAGDVTGNGVVNLGDAIYTKMKVGAAVAANARFDVNLSGAIDLTDVSVAKGAMGTSVSCP